MLLYTHPQLLGLIQAAAVQNQNPEPESNLIQTDGHQRQIEIDHSQVQALPQTQSTTDQDVEKSQNQTLNIAEVHTQISPKPEVQVRDSVNKVSQVFVLESN